MRTDRGRHDVGKGVTQVRMGPSGVVQERSKAISLSLSHRAPSVMEPGERCSGPAREAGTFLEAWRYVGST